MISTVPPDINKLADDIFEARNRLFLMIGSAELIHHVDRSRIQVLKASIEDCVEQAIFAIKEPYEK